MAAFVLFRYLPLFLGAASGDPIAAEFREAHTFYWSIVLLDLGAAVPLTLATAVSLLRGTETGGRGVYAVVGWFALVPPSVVAMAAVMVVRGDPHASVPTLTLVTVALWAVTWQAFRGSSRRFRHSAEDDFRWLYGVSHPIVMRYPSGVTWWTGILRL